MLWKIVLGLFAVLMIAQGIGHYLNSARIESEGKRLAVANKTIADRKKADDEAIRVQRQDEFTKRRTEILSDIRAKMAAKKWDEARAAALPYKDISDPEYVSLAAAAFDGWNAAEKHRAANAKVVAEKERRANLRKQDPEIGMHWEDVVLTSWGKPSNVNTTKTARGTTMQWVYEKGYLYFDESGRITTIQNRY